MNLDTIIQRKIRRYNAKGGLAHTAKLVLLFMSVNHGEVKKHVQRMALLAEAVAVEMKKDAKATFFAGLLHDIGKVLLPYNHFDGHNITEEEFEEVKTHARAGFEVLRELHSFVALCAGFHHKLYEAGYGITMSDFPKDWSLSTVKKVLEISAILSVCDYIEAATSRDTEIKDGSGKGGANLKSRLMLKYPDDYLVIDIALKQFKKLEM